MGDVHFFKMLNKVADFYFKWCVILCDSLHTEKADFRKDTRSFGFPNCNKDEDFP